MTLEWVVGRFTFMPDLKLFIVKKFVMAKTASDAIRKEKKHPADDVWMDETWRKNELEKNTQDGKVLGFK